jgi:hypothetical protein
MIRLGSRPVVALVLTGALVLGACGDSGEGAGGGSIASTAPTTTLPDAAYSAIALEEAAVEFGNAMLDENVPVVHTMMTRRCRELVTRAHLAAVLNLILRAMERQQGVTTAEVRVVGALAGEIVDGQGEASMRLNSEVFEDPEFAFLDMQPWIFEEGAWRYDACDSMRAEGGNPAADFRDTTSTSMSTSSSAPASTEAPASTTTAP